MTTFHYETQPLPADLSAGAEGLVQALSLLTLRPVDELMVLSGFAFRNYFLTPDDNHAYRQVVDDREWAWGSLEIENYGILESLSLHLERELRFWAFPRPADFLALARLELEAGRPLLILRGDTPRRVELLSRLELGPREFQVALPPGLEPATRHAIPGLESWGEGGPPIAAIALRPPVDPGSDRRREILRRDVLDFAGRHAGSRKELSYGEELFYASGLRAWEMAAECLTSRWRGGPEPEFVQFWELWTGGLERGRRAAASVLERWAVSNPDFGAAAQAYAALAEAIPRVSDQLGWEDPATREHLAQALQDAGELEAAALDHLARAVANLPPL